MYKLIPSILLLISCFIIAGAQASSAPPVKSGFEYKLLATKRVTTMEKEMKEAASAGYRFLEVANGPTAVLGQEALILMGRERNGDQKQRFEYKLLATSKTSTMQKELQEAGDAGFEHRGQSVYIKTFSNEVMVILERE